jgi:hypothetical protein
MDQKAEMAELKSKEKVFQLRPTVKITLQDLEDAQQYADNIVRQTDPEYQRKRDLFRLITCEGDNSTLLPRPKTLSKLFQWIHLVAPHIWEWDSTTQEFLSADKLASSSLFAGLDRCIYLLKGTLGAENIQPGSLVQRFPILLQLYLPSVL